MRRRQTRHSAIMMTKPRPPALPGCRQRMIRRISSHSSNQAVYHYIYPGRGRSIHMDGWMAADVDRWMAWLQMMSIEYCSCFYFFCMIIARNFWETSNRHACCAGLVATERLQTRSLEGWAACWAGPRLVAGCHF